MKTLDKWRRVGSPDAAILKRCKGAVVQAVGAAKVILYGSRARRGVDWQHDMDLLVLLPGPVAPAAERKIHDVLFEIELDAEIVISAIVMAEADFHPDGDRSVPWSRRVGRDGVVA